MKSPPTSALLRPHQPQPYQRLDEPALRKLAFAANNGELFSNELAPPEAMPYIFPLIGQAMAISQAQAAGLLDKLLVNETPEGRRLLLVNAEAVLKELRDNDCLMVYNYLARQIPRTSRNPLQQPPGVADLPMFADFLYLDTKDYEAYRAYRGELNPSAVAQKPGDATEEVAPTDEGHKGDRREAGPGSN